MTKLPKISQTITVENLPSLTVKSADLPSFQRIVTKVTADSISIGRIVLKLTVNQYTGKLMYTNKKLGLVVREW